VFGELAYYAIHVIIASSVSLSTFSDRVALLDNDLTIA
jgi:hypothetical protein